MKKATELFPLKLLADDSRYNYNTLKSHAHSKSFGVLIGRRRFMTKKQFSDLCNSLEQSQIRLKGKKIKYYEKST